MGTSKKPMNRTKTEGDTCAENVPLGEGGMSDIVERLRQSVTKGHEPTDELAIEAAAQIERLTRMLLRAENFVPAPIREEIRRALAGEEKA